MNRAPVALTTVAPDLKSFDVPAAEAVDGSADSDAAVALTTVASDLKSLAVPAADTADESADSYAAVATATLLARLSNRISSPRQLPLLMPSHLTPSLM